MALPDPALLELTETLNATGLFWLANEVLAGVAAGHVDLEDEATLAAARRAAARDLQHDHNFEADIAGEARPFSREEQIDWAAHFVVTRLKGVIAMTASSIERIERIETGVPRSPSSAAPIPATIVFGDDEAGEQTTGADLRAAAAAMPALLKAISDWREAAKGPLP